MDGDEHAMPPGPPNRPNRGGRPPKIRISTPEAKELASQSPDELADKLSGAIAMDIEILSRTSRRRSLSTGEVDLAGKLARALETCARAKRHALEAQKENDLTSIPAEQLARAVVRAMRNDPGLRQAIANEMRLETAA